MTTEKFRVHDLFSAIEGVMLLRNDVFFLMSPV